MPEWTRKMDPRVTRHGSRCQRARSPVKEITLPDDTYLQDSRKEPTYLRSYP